MPGRPAYGHPGYHDASRSPSVDGLAVGALICGIAAVLFIGCAVAVHLLGLVTLVVAVGATRVTRFIARNRVTDSAGTKGAGMALAGAICGLFSLAVSLFYLVIVAERFF